MRSWKVIVWSLFLISYSGYSQIEQRYEESSADQIICRTNSYNNPSCSGNEDLNFLNEPVDINSGDLKVDPNSINDSEVIYHNDYSRKGSNNEGTYLNYPGNIPERFQYSDPYEMREDPYEATYPNPYQPTTDEFTLEKIQD